MQLGRTIEQLNDIKDPDALLISAKAHKASMSLFYYVQEMWDQVVNDDPQWNWHIPYLCAELTKVAIRVANKVESPYDLLINIPPGTTKSLLTGVFFPSWAWTRWPWMQFIKTSHSAPLSLEHAEMCRDLVRSEKYQTWYPNIRIKRDKDTKSNFRITYKDKKTNLWTIGGNLFSTSVAGTATGFHGHINLVDDAIDPFKAISPVELATANRFVTQVLPSRTKDKDVATMIMIMQRVVEGDPSDVMIEQREKGLGVRHICLPGKLETKEDHERVQPPEVKKFYQDGYLDPVRLGQGALDKLRIKLGTYGYSAQIQQDSVIPGGGMFDVTKFKITKEEDINWAYHLIRIVRYWDKAATQDGGAYTAGVKIAELRNERYVVLDVVRGQWATNKRERVIKDTTIKDGPNVLQKIEQEPGSGGKDSANATKRTLSRVGAAVHLERPVGNKIYRADPWSVRVNDGRVYLIEGPWNKEYIEEHRKFGELAKYKDQVDASSGAYSELFNVNKAGTWGKK